MAKPLDPPIEPYDHGLLDVGDGNRVDWVAAALDAFARRLTS